MKQSVKLVNAGLAGEPEIICFQNQQTSQLFKVEDIDRIYVDGGFRDYEPDDWKLALNNENHIAEIDVLENGNLVLYV